MPAGSGGADSRANGFPPFWLAGFVSGVFVDSGDGDGEVVCACVLAVAKQPHKRTEAKRKRKAMLYTRFIISPPKVFLAA